MTYIALYNTTKSRAELACKFELSAISIGDLRGYRIKIEHGKTGIYLGKRDAVIRGMTDEDLLAACHVFACMRDNITCPQNFSAMKSMVDKADSVAVVLDSGAGSEAGRGYAELVGVLSYIQADRVDTNHDSILSQEEINNNTFFIYPFIKQNDTCTMQPMHSLIENLSKSNMSRDCDLEDAVYVLKSDRSELKVEGSKVILSGNDKALHTEAIILRDTLDPEWVLRIYNL